MTFKDGDYVKMIGYRGFPFVVGQLYAQSGYLYMKYLTKVDGQVAFTDTFGLVFDSLGNVVDDVPYGPVIKRITKGQFKEYARKM